jgi:protein SCO1
MKFMLLSAILIGLIALSGCSKNADADEAPAQDRLEQSSFDYVDDLRGAVLTPPRVIPDFSFASTTGKDFTMGDYRGKVVLLYFGYMTCPDVCPTTLADLMRAYRALEEPKDEVVIAFITVDPERDTLERMQRYTGAFHDDFVGVRSDDAAALGEVLENFGVSAESRQVESSLGYLIDHTASVFVVGPDGALVEQFLYGTPYKDIAHDVALLIQVP